MTMSFAGQTAVAGIGATEFSKDSGKGSSEFHIGSNFIVFWVLEYKMEYF